MAIIDFTTTEATLDASAKIPVETTTTKGFTTQAKIVGGATSAATGKTTPVDADVIPVADSAASFGLKKLTWANLKATLKTYFDTLYATTAQANATHTGDATGATALTLATVNSNVGSFTSANITVDGKGRITAAANGSGGGGGSGTVTSVSVTTANGVSGSVATATTTPAITLTLGAIAPTSVTASGNVTGANLSGTNTGDGSGPSAIITEATTARTLALTDIDKYIRLTGSSACTITVPANASVDWAAQAKPPVIYFRVAGAGIPVLSITGVTVNDQTAKMADLTTGDTFALQWVASNIWDLI